LTKSRGDFNFHTMNEKDMEKKKESTENQGITRETVLEALKEVYDPEIPLNIVDLGLIYGIEIEDGKVDIKMTLTAVGCPLAATIAEMVHARVMEIPGVKETHVDVVWDPPWTIDRISEEGKKVLRSFGFNI